MGIVGSFTDISFCTSKCTIETQYFSFFKHLNDCISLEENNSWFYENLFIDWLEKRLSNQVS